MPVELRFGALQIDKPLLLWINDGLMARFFLLVALEIKRETLGGQIASRDQLMLPLVCAVASVAVPAGIYWWLNRGASTALSGWAIPTATDIPFAMGILALLGDRQSGVKGKRVSGRVALGGRRIIKTTHNLSMIT